MLYTSTFIKKQGRYNRNIFKLVRRETSRYLYS